MDLGFWLSGEFHPYYVRPLPPAIAAAPVAVLDEVRAERAGPSARARSRARSHALPQARSLGPPARSPVGRALAELGARRHPAPAEREAILAAVGRRGASATEVGQRVAELSLKRLRGGKYKSAYRAYVRVCLERGEEPEPVTVHKVVTLITEYVAVSGCQSASLSSLLTRLAGYRRGHGMNWLSADEMIHVTAQRNLLKRMFPYCVTPAEAITYEELDTVVRFLRLRPGLFNMQLIAMMLLGHDGLLRGSEILRLLVSDLVFVDPGPTSGRGGIDLALWSRKTGKERLDPRADGTMIVRRTGELRDTFAAVQAYIRDASLGPSDMLFPDRDQASGAVAAADGMPYRKFSEAVRAAFRAAGVPNADAYTGRGLRSGGHTDLYREVQDFELIGLLGGWKSARAQALYLRAHKLNFSFLSAIIGE